MKRSIVTAVALLLVCGAATAQETTKEKKEYLPKAGEFAIGFDAAPLLRYAGNIFNGNTNNSLTAVGGAPVLKTTIRPDVSIMGKYMLTDKWALRANLGVQVKTTTNSYYVTDDAAQLDNPLSEQKVIDRITTANHGGSILLGAEYRLGKRRIQGVFGAGLLFAFQNNNVNYSYGNTLTEINQRPSVSGSMGSVYNSNGYRVLKNHGDRLTDFYTGIAGSAGFEWFVAPKISLGMEVNLTLYYQFGNQRYEISEGYNTVLQQVEVRTDLVSPGNGTFYLGTDSLGGALNMNFYF